MKLKFVWIIFILIITLVLFGSIYLVSPPPLVTQQNSAFYIKETNQVESYLLKSLQNAWNNKSYEDAYELARFLKENYPDYYKNSNLNKSESLLEQNYLLSLAQKKWIYEDVFLGSSKIIQAEIFSDENSDIKLGFLFNKESIYKKSYLKLNDSIEDCSTVSGCVIKIEFNQEVTFIKVFPQEEKNVYIFSDYNLILNLIMNQKKLIFHTSNINFTFDVHGLDKQRFQLD